MCTALSHKPKIADLVDYFPSMQIDLWEEYEPYRAAYRLAFEHSPQPVITVEGNSYKLNLFEWGVVANYMNTPEMIRKNRAWMCNARAEKLQDKKSYWFKIRSQRCLVPVTGIYEHRKVKGIKNKIPYFISLKDRDIFCLPGLYNFSPVPNQETGELAGTFAIITRGANDLMKQIHNDGENKFRMPLFLTKSLEKEWIDPNTPDERIFEILSFEMPEQQMNSWPVYSLNAATARPDHLLPNDPYSWQGLPPLGLDDSSLQTSLF